MVADGRALAGSDRRGRGVRLSGVDGGHRALALYLPGAGGIMTGSLLAYAQEVPGCNG